MAVEGRESRLAQVKHVLLWEGRVSRARLIERHGLSGVRASEWLREFRESHEDWVEWDPRRRSFLATEKAYQEAQKETIRAPAADLIGGTVDSTSHRAGITLVLPWDFEKVSPRTFARLHMAIEDGRRIQFTYSSMGNPRPHLRTIEPHTLVKAGRRWHVRGYCMERESFRDFVLGRMSEPRILDQACDRTQGDDEDWSTIVKVRLVAHPLLSQDQQRVVREEYFSGTAARVESCRGPLVSYLLQDLRVAIEPERQQPPDFQLAVENKEDCWRWLFPI